MRRGLAVGLALGAAAVAAGGGWLAGRGIKSPEQVALEAEPPAASLITVGVELAELNTDVITRADVGYDEPELLGLGGALGDRESALVVTSAPERGQELAEGEVAIEIAGRPVFVLVGAVPVYRDMRPQDSGPDVLQLEEALERLGHFDATPDRLWDHQTSEALQAMYEEAGYNAAGVSDSERTALEAARERLKAAEDSLERATKTLTEASEGPTDLQLRQARTDLSAARIALTQAEMDEQDAPQTAQGAREDAERAVSAAEDGLVDARKATEDAAHARDEAQRAVGDAESALDSARRDVGNAQWGTAITRAAREQAAIDHNSAKERYRSARSGVHPDTGMVPSPSEHESLRLAAAAAERALAQAERSVTDAEWAEGEARRAVEGAELRVQAAKRAVSDADRLVETSLAAVEDARADIERRRAAIPTDAEVAQQVAAAGLSAQQAADRLASAEQALEELLEPPDLDELSKAVDAAQTERDRAAEDLADLEGSLGVWMPAGEVIFLKRLPVRVDRLTAERGATVSGPFMTVTGSELAVRGSVSERDVDRVVEGGEAFIEDRSLAEPVAATIRLVDIRAGTRDVAPDRHYVEIVADGIPEDLVGRNIKVRIPVGGTEGAVLVVPAAALSATADGSTHLEVSQGGGATRTVTVNTGLSTGGRVEVEPVDGALEPGDLVVVGVAAGE